MEVREDALVITCRDGYKSVQAQFISKLQYRLHVTVIQVPPRAESLELKQKVTFGCFVPICTGVALAARAGPVQGVWRLHLSLECD